MNVKAEAYQEWSQAAVVDKLITNMAEIVRAMAEPLNKVDKITIVSTGDGSSVGANKLTGEMTQIAAQVPALFEALSGMKMSDLMSNVKQMVARPNGSNAAPAGDRRRRRHEELIAANIRVAHPRAASSRWVGPTESAATRRRHHMALMERVATLLRANVNDLIDRAEDPEKMLKQLVLDMENQLLQVKTQVAIAIADQHLLGQEARRARGRCRRLEAQSRARRLQAAGRARPRRAGALASAISRWPKASPGSSPSRPPKPKLCALPTRKLQGKLKETEEPVRDARRATSPRAHGRQSHRRTQRRGRQHHLAHLSARPLQSPHSATPKPKTTPAKRCSKATRSTTSSTCWNAMSRWNACSAS